MLAFVLVAFPMVGLIQQIVASILDLIKPVYIGHTGKHSCVAGYILPCLHHFFIHITGKGNNRFTGGKPFGLKNCQIFTPRCGGCLILFLNCSFLKIYPSKNKLIECNILKGKFPARNGKYPIR